MSRRRVSAESKSNTAPDTSGLVGPDDLLELWFSLSKRDWSSIVIAPAHPNGSTDDLAKALAAAGKHLSEYPVSALTLKMLGAGTVRAMAALAQHVRRNEPIHVPRGEMNQLLLDDGEPLGGKRDRSPARIDTEPMEGLLPPAGQLIISIPSVLSDPLGIAVARAADGVVLAVELGRTKMSETAKSVEAIGREHIIGTCLLRRDSTDDTAQEK